MNMNVKVVKCHRFHATKVLLILMALKSFISCNKKQPDLIYILEWTTSVDWAYLHLEMGQKAFMNRKCTFQKVFSQKIVHTLAIY